MVNNVFSPDNAIVAIVVASIGWLLTYLLHSTILLAGAWVASAVIRLSEAAREALWKVALVGGVVTATAQLALPGEPLGGRISLPTTRVQESSDYRLMVTARVDDAQPSGGRTTFTRPVTAAPTAVAALTLDRPDVMKVFVARKLGVTWAGVLFFGWVVGAGVCLLWLGAVQARTSRALADRTDITDSPLGAPLVALLARAGIERRIRLSWSASLSSPVALSGGEVCLPRRALVALEPQAVESMLAHEVAHVMRRDPEWLTAAHFIAALLFFQPLNRLALRRLRESAEYLSDDWAVERTGAPVALAKCLASVAEWLTTSPRMPMATAMVERRGSPLTRRVRRILSGGPQSADPHGWRALSLGAVALVVLTGAAPRIAVPSAPQRGDLAVWIGQASSRPGVATGRVRRAEPRQIEVIAGGSERAERILIRTSDQP